MAPTYYKVTTPCVYTSGLLERSSVLPRPSAAVALPLAQVKLSLQNLGSSSAHLQHFKAVLPPSSNSKLKFPASSSNEPGGCHQVELFLHPSFLVSPFFAASDSWCQGGVLHLQDNCFQEAGEVRAPLQDLCCFHSPLNHAWAAKGVGSP